MTRMAALLLILALVSHARGDAAGDTRSLDDDALIVGHTLPTISPNGRWVAYLSRGFVCVVPADASVPPRRLMEVADCESHLLARPENEHANGDFYALVDKELPRREQIKASRALRDQITATVHNLRWTPDSSQLVWGIHRRDARQESWSTEFWASAVEGKPRRLCRIESDDISQRGVGRGYLISRDLRFLVQPGQSQRHRPLIWDVATNRPRATPFLSLTPSATSDRWIGVEKDTRQLVVTNADFVVQRRYEVYRDPRSYGFELRWSPDERFVIWRNQVGFDHYSNWEGFALDLESGRKAALSGQYLRGEHFRFTGRGGEFLRSGLEGKPNRFISGTEVTGAGVRLYSRLDEKPQELWRCAAAPAAQRSNRLWMSLPHASRDGSRFAVCLPRDDVAKPWCHWHLIDRNGKRRPVLKPDANAFESPCKIAGFAENDELLIGYTTSRLFAVPIGPAPAE